MTVQFSWVGRPSCGKVLSSLNAINTGICVPNPSLICISFHNELIKVYVSIKVYVLRLLG